jgi:RNA polymerase sigma factor (sigma-70 family)
VVVTSQDRDLGRSVEQSIDPAHSFEDFFRAEYPGLLGTLSLVAGNRAEAEELVQESFLKLWERWGSLEEHPHLSGYLYRTALNLARNRFRQAARVFRLSPPSRAEETGFSLVEDRDDIRRALQALSRRQRLALVLVDLMDMTSEEAAQILRIKPTTVRALASQARRALRESANRTGENGE